MYIFKTLSNGIRVVAEKIDYLKSVSIGVWVGNGSRYENAEVNGISHFIEHMVFKGTNNRTADDIALEMDSVGGQLNAFTAREYTCFYTKTLDEHCELAMDILSDMIFEPLLDGEDMKKERGVINEEINMYEDSPEDLVYDLLSVAVWGDTPMGRPILGTKDSLGNITPEIMRNYMKTHYTNKNIVISVSGNFSDDFFDKLEEYFGKRNISEDYVKFKEAAYTPSNVIKTKDIEQVQLAVAFEGIDTADDDVYSLLVFNNVFGCGMSSRLFRNIREKYGLVYSIGAGHSAYMGTGTFDISAGMGEQNVEKVCSLICDEVKRIKKEKLTKEEVERAKEQLKGGYILSYESTGARMQGAGRAILLDRPVYTQDEVLKMINAVDTESVAKVIDKVLNTDTLAVAAVGPIENMDGYFDFD